MKTSRRGKKIAFLLLELLILIFLVIWIYPFLNIFFNSFKSTKEMMTEFMSLPKTWDFSNFVISWNKLYFFKAMLNTAIVTVFGVFGVVFISSMAAYKLARTKSRLSNIFYLFLLIPMMVPFQTSMISLTQVTKALGLNGSLPGMILIYWGTLTPFTIFLYHGFIKSLPIQLDESARIDGASQFRTYLQIIFPLLKPITATAVVINALGIWNDFLLPLLVLGGNKNNRTIQLALYSNFGTQGVQWEIALPGIIIAMIPAIIFFITLQKYIVKGVAAGAVKG